MKKIFTIIIISCLVSTSWAQSLITGIVKDKSGESVIGANVFLVDTYDGASTDVNGAFKFSTAETGAQQLRVTYIGFVDHEAALQLPQANLALNIVLEESFSRLEAVVISAGSFTAGEETNREVLKPLDIVTTAGATADIAGALNTLPGTQKVGETGRLFVRGGEGYETRTFIDGVEVMNAYSPSAPNAPSRGRFSPFMFKGTSFSTGGYSAEYGQALSSALILKSKDVPEETRTDLSFMTVGTDISHSHALNDGAIAGKLQYTNLTPYFKAVSQKMDWDKAPQSVDGNFMFRKALNDKNMLKIYSNFSWSEFVIYQPRIYPDNISDRVALTNQYNYFNSTYRSILNEQWSMQTGLSYTRNEDDTKLNDDKFSELEEGMHIKSVFTNDVSEKFSISFGGEHFRRSYNFQYQQEMASEGLNFKQDLSAAFVEADIYASKKFVSRVGARGEYNALQSKFYVVPRFSLAYKTDEHSQISIAYGQFNQTGPNELIRINSELEDEKAHHYIVNYQREIKGRTFRIEGYYKEYDQLIKFGENAFDPTQYSNDGSGYARGMDIFWRDSKTLKGVDYWLSYSFLDTERDYRDFPYSSRPHFASKHNFSAVLKYFVSSIKSQVGATYSFTSGRPYNNPNLTGFNTELTAAYHDLSVNLSYLMKSNVIIHGSVTNVLGIDNVFGYESSSQLDESGQYRLRAIKQPAPRFIFLGVFITLSKDKSMNQLPVL